MKTEVLALWESEEHGYGKDLKVFATAEALLDYIEHALSALIVLRDRDQWKELRATAEAVVDEATRTLADGGEWEFYGTEEHDGHFEGLRLMAKWCEVRE